jgi:hypothetical protein
MISIQMPNRFLEAKKKDKEIVVFLDLDGIITDWYTPAAKLCGVDLNNKEVRSKLRKGECDLSDFISDETVWKNIDAEGPKFWLNLKLFPWAMDLYNALKKTGHHIAFLSSPGKNNPIPCTPKHEYLIKHFGEDVDIVLAYNKWHCAGPNKILIDDSKKKRDAFLKNGGQVFAWPNQFQLEDDGNVNKVIEQVLVAIKDLADNI